MERLKEMFENDFFLIKNISEKAGKAKVSLDDHDGFIQLHPED